MIAEGVCKLTGEKGRFVDAHLLPKALTRAGRKNGEKFIEDGPEVVRRRVASSWYDPRLVIASGEALLARLDSSGIQELRRSGLVWSSSSHANLVAAVSDGSPNVRIQNVRIPHPKRLRMFLLSLLWRSVASELDAFSKIGMDEAELESLRRLVLQNESGADDEFPVLLWALAGPGPEHNHTPIFQKSDDPGAEIPADYFRFYLDGLLIIFGSRFPKEEFWKTIKPFWKSENSMAEVIVQPFEHSRQKRDLYDVMLGLGWQETLRNNEGTHG